MPNGSIKFPSRSSTRAMPRFAGGFGTAIRWTKKQDACILNPIDKSDTELAAEYGCTPSAIQKRRRKLKTAQKEALLRRNRAMGFKFLKTRAAQTVAED